MKITSKFMALIIFIILFGGILITTLLGWWQTESTKTPARFVDGEAAGEYNPADIRGSYTFGDVSTLFEIPIETLAIAFNLPQENPAGFALKSLESIYDDAGFEIGTGSVRMFVAWYKGLPYEPTESTYLLKEAVAILLAQGNLSPDQITYLENHTADPTGNAAENLSEPVLVEEPIQNQTATPQIEPVVEPTEHAKPERMVNGQTTFQNLLDWGIAIEDIETIINAKMPETSTLVKDFATANGIQFSSLKTALQALADAIAP